MLMATFAISNATHFAGGHIEYECLGGNQYTIRLISYFDCNFTSASPPTFVDFSIQSSCGDFNITANSIVLDSNTGATQLPVTGYLCSSMQQCSECNINTPTPSCPEVLPGIKKLIYEATATINACSDWNISYSSCCRSDPSPNISNHSGSGGIYIYSTLDNSLGCNNSPNNVNDIPVFICEGIETTLNFGANDPDGDSLVYSLIYPFEDPNTPISISPGYNETNFILTSAGVYLNAFTGSLTLIPSDGSVGVNQTAYMALKIEEFRNGILIGESINDLIFTTLEDCDTNQVISVGITSIMGGTYLSDSTALVCVGDTINFDITIVDFVNQNSIQVLSNVENIFSNTTFTASSGNLVVCTTTIIPDSTEVGIHEFYIQATDDGCPITNPQTYNFTVTVVDTCGSFQDETSILEAKPTFPVSIFPNPAEKQLTIDLGALNNARFTIIDITGKLMQSALLTQPKTLVDIHLTSGIYFIKIDGNNVHHHEKLIIK